MSATINKNGTNYKICDSGRGSIVVENLNTNERRTYEDLYTLLEVIPSPDGNTIFVDCDFFYDNYAYRFLDFTDPTQRPRFLGIQQDEDSDLYPEDNGERIEVQWSPEGQCTLNRYRNFYPDHNMYEADLWTERKEKFADMDLKDWREMINQRKKIEELDLSVVFERQGDTMVQISRYVSDRRYSEENEDIGKA